jgi:hypothetical protein
MSKHLERPSATPLAATPSQATPAAPRDHMNLQDRFELRDWALILDTSPERLLEAAGAVGNRVTDVEDWLRSHTDGAGEERA